jgi:hypothetical protein
MRTTSGASGRQATIETYGISSRAVTAMTVVPFLLLGVTILGLAVPATSRATSHQLDENQIVEVLTFLFFGLSGLFGLVLAARLRRTEPAVVVAFYALFSVGLLILAGEEISWGQWMFHWKAPAEWKALNSQGETNLHNLAALGHHNDWLRLAFGLGALLGVALARVPAFTSVAAPAVLAPCFLLVTVHAGIDVANDFVSLGTTADWVIRRSSEMVELLIAVGAGGYLVLNGRRLAPRASRAAHGARQAPEPRSAM